MTTHLNYHLLDQLAMEYYKAVQHNLSERDTIRESLWQETFSYLMNFAKCRLRGKFPEYEDLVLEMNLPNLMDQFSPFRGAYHSYCESSLYSFTIKYYRDGSLARLWEAKGKHTALVNKGVDPELAIAEALKTYPMIDEAGLRWYLNFKVMSLDVDFGDGTPQYPYMHILHADEAGHDALNIDRSIALSILPQRYRRLLEQIYEQRRFHELIFDKPVFLEERVVILDAALGMAKAYYQARQKKVEASA